ncbi:Vps62-related protein [Azospirillum sp. sgz302134]
MLEGMLISVGWTSTDKGSGAKMDLSVYRTVVPPGWFWMGMLAVKGHRSEKERSKELVVRPHPNWHGPAPLVECKTFQRVWDVDKISNSFFQLYRAVPPNGYMAVGDMFDKSTGETKPGWYVQQYACFHPDCLETVELGGEIWNDRGSNSTDDGSMWEIPGASPDGEWRRFRATAGYGKPGGPAYRLKMSQVEIIENRTDG